LPVSYYYIYSYSAISLSFLEVSILFWLEVEVFTVFFTDVERLGFLIYYLLGYYILGDYFLVPYFFKFTPELLLSALFVFLGGILFGGIEG